ncbi:unnamed protein product [Periconia digitata]|uniref:Uncharacterized protein n=1 Tax=Periconia digitata TaxID=1303443 RepID=A0A9W4UP86_9PLEO|nr:unnamed protein product [Periconia digitata]
MDEEDILAILFLLTILSLPLTLVLLTTSIIAYSRTKKWDLERRQRGTKSTSSDPEASASLLPENEDEEEDDFLDSEDEAEETARKVEAEKDSHKTFAQMWRKEFRRVWSGKGVKRIAEERERAERKKLAKAVAKELDRRERRRQRKAAAAAAAQGESLELDVLPKYEK